MPSLYYCLSVRAGCLVTSLWSLVYSLTNTAIASHHISGDWTWLAAISAVCDSIQSKVVLELHPPHQQTNQTEIFSSASFNFLYKVYYKTGKSYLSLTMLQQLCVWITNHWPRFDNPSGPLAGKYLCDGFFSLTSGRYSQGIDCTVLYCTVHGTINPRIFRGSVSPGSCLPLLLSFVTSLRTSGSLKRFIVYLKILS